VSEHENADHKAMASRCSCESERYYDNRYTLAFENGIRYCQGGVVIVRSNYSSVRYETAETGDNKNEF